MEIIEQQKYVSVPSNKTQITEHFKPEFQITNDTYLMDLTNTNKHTTKHTKMPP